MDVDDDCKKVNHVEGVLQSVLNKQSTGTGTGGVIVGKGALDKINTEGKRRSRRQSFDGFDVEDGTDSSEENGRSQGTEGYGGLTKVGGSHIHTCVCSIVDKRAMITASNIAYHDCPDV